MNEEQLRLFASDLAFAGIKATVRRETERGPRGRGTVGVRQGSAIRLRLDTGCEGIRYSFFWNGFDGHYEGFESGPHEAPPTALEETLALGIGIP